VLACRRVCGGGRLRRRGRLCHSRSFDARLGRSRSPWQARTTANHRVVEARLHQRFLTFSLDGPADAIRIGKVEVRHVVRHVDSERANLCNHVFGREADLFGQLVHAHLGAGPTLSVAAGISTIKSASNHRDLPAVIDRPGTQCA
jgi:hypothetical protein